MKKVLPIAATITLLAGCNSLVPQNSGNASVEIKGGPTPLITATMAEVKDGAAVFDRMFISRTWKLEENESSYKFSINFIPPFSSLDSFLAFFKDQCNQIGGSYRNSICWNNDRTRINFYAEAFISQYRDLNNQVFINVVEPRESTDMVQFSDELAGSAKSLPSIRFTTGEMNRFQKLVQLETVYDNLSTQIKYIPGFNNISDDEAVMAAKTIHEALADAASPKPHVYHYGEEIIGYAQSSRLYQRGNEWCADLSLKRKEGLSPSAIRDFSRAISGDNGLKTTTNMLCTNVEDRDGFKWSFRS